MGFIDSSEMFDTYGESLHSIRGFVKDAYQDKGVMFNTGTDLHSKDILFRLSYNDFINDIIPTLSNKDTIVFGIITDPDTNSHIDSDYRAAYDIAKECKQKSSNCILVNIGRDQDIDDKENVFVHKFGINLMEVKNIFPKTSFKEEFCWKLVCNAITTCSCIRKGVVYRNDLINMGVCNYKLYLRTIEMISDITGVDRNNAELALIRGIYQGSPVIEEETQDRIIRATQIKRLIPTAILLAYNPQFNFDQVISLLNENPIIRLTIKKFANK